MSARKKSSPTPAMWHDSKHLSPSSINAVSSWGRGGWHRGSPRNSRTTDYVISHSGFCASKTSPTRNGITNEKQRGDFTQNFQTKHNLLLLKAALSFQPWASSVCSTLQETVHSTRLKRKAGCRADQFTWLPLSQRCWQKKGRQNYNIHLALGCSMMMMESPLLFCILF